MSDLILYLIMAGIGYVIGTKSRHNRDKLKWTGKVQTVAITILVVAMGSRMGANEEVVKNLSTIGLTAFIITVVVLAFSIIGIIITRKIMGLNKYGLMKSQVPAAETAADYVEPEKDGEMGKGIDKMTIIIVIAVFLGMAFGYFFADKLFPSFETFDKTASLLIKIGLCVLLFFVGLDLGLDETVKENFKKVGFRCLVFPFVTMAMSMAGAMLCGLFMPISMKEAAAVGAGLGWYSLAPGIIMEAGYVTASAISFMHNVMRELFSIIFIPLVAKHIGYLETTAMPGAAAMDVCLPIVEKSTSSNTAIYSFISGVILSMAVPILVPLVVS